MAANYFAEVTFIKNRNRTNYIVGAKISEYPFCQGNVDSFTFSKKGFTLSARRSSIYADGTILNNERNGLYQQIIKGLLVYYALSNDFPILKSITTLMSQVLATRHVWPRPSNIFSCIAQT